MSPHVLRGAAFGVGLAAALAFAAPAMASYSATVDGTTLRVAGDGASDKVALFADADHPRHRRRRGRHRRLHASRAASFTAVSVTAGGGDDEVRIQGLPLDGVTVDGGAGNDTLLGGAGRRHAHRRLRQRPRSTATRAPTRSRSAPATTRFQWDPGDGSRRRRRRRRQRHARTSTAPTSARRSSLVAERHATRASRATSRRSTWTSTAIEQVNVRTLGGADTMTVGDLAGTGVRGVDVDLQRVRRQRRRRGRPRDRQRHRRARPRRAQHRRDDAASSTVSRSTCARPAWRPRTALTAALLGGDDTATARPRSRPAPIQVGVDGGEGTDTATYNGTAGDDAIGIARNGTTTVAAFATGAPTVQRRPRSRASSSRASTATTRSPARTASARSPSLTLDGGNGDDTLRGGDGADTLLGGGRRRPRGRQHRRRHRARRLRRRPLAVGSGRRLATSSRATGGNDTLDFNGSNAGEQITLHGQRPARDACSATSPTSRMDVDGVEAVRDPHARQRRRRDRRRPHRHRPARRRRRPAARSTAPATARSTTWSPRAPTAPTA